MQEPLTLDANGRNMMFPTHVLLDADGTIVDLGRTLAKLLGRDVIGGSFWDHVDMRRPTGAQDVAGLIARSGSKLSLHVRVPDRDPILMRGVAIPMRSGGDQYVLIDLSIGGNFAQVMAAEGLTATDFRPNDMTIDLLYAFETQKGLLQESQQLAERLRQAKAEAEDIATTDPLTGLANRRGLQMQLQKILDGRRRKGKHALLMIDLDRFKSINDTFGHDAGDAVLLHTADCIRSVARAPDQAVRIGGDEFALLLVDHPIPVDFQALAGRLARMICQPVPVGTTHCTVEVSIGLLALDGAAGAPMSRIMKEADIALYEAKAGQTPVVPVTPALLQRHDRVRQLEQDIERGLAADEFEAYFQPQIRLSDGRLSGLEVLARWHHPVRGTVLPGQFLDAAERSHQIVALDRQVRRKALSDFATLDFAPGEEATLSLNVIGANLRAPEFELDLLHRLHQLGLRPEQITLELLETIFFEQGDDAFLRRCRQLREAGFNLAIDDFGTGHASISTLIEAPVSTLKLDRSFVSGIDQNARLPQIVGPVVRMARDLDLNVLAEGAETVGEVRALRHLGCHVAQGFYFAQPMAVDDLQSWINAAERARA